MSELWTFIATSDSPNDRDDQRPGASQPSRESQLPAALVHPVVRHCLAIDVSLFV
jgi:hypothetical protein